MTRVVARSFARMRGGAFASGSAFERGRVDCLTARTGRWGGRVERKGTDARAMALERCARVVARAGRSVDGWWRTRGGAEATRGFAAAAARGREDVGAGGGRRTLMIVESPAKAKTIEKYLGPGAKVLASYGHVRDLLNKQGSVRPEEAFAMTWTSTSRQRAAVKEIADALKGSDVLLLATDPDREGEAISWHLLEVLREKKLLRDDLDVKRVTFGEITKNAVLDAVASPREINAPMVDAYMARRALDYLFGFTLSGLLWRKLPSSVSLSAGRVQSVALRLICEREEEVEAFVSEPYWSVTASLLSKDGASFEAALTHVDGEKLGKFTISSNDQSEGYARRVRECETLRVTGLKRSEAKRSSGPPFTTSTMQQEANKQLGFGASRTMSAAQRLYEGAGTGEGLITYMRTDGTYVAPHAIASLRETAQELFGDGYVPEEPRYFKKVQKNAQEAHEAIRPTKAGRLPAQVAKMLGPGSDEARLYALIWARTMASQMSPALSDRIAAEISSEQGDLKLKANGNRLKFPGFLAAYRTSRPDAAPPSDDAWLPELNEGETLFVNKDDQSSGCASTQHQTTPPPRYTDGSIVKALEERGIGRPSTYAPILKVLAQREYVAKQGAALIPTTRGRLVSAFLTNYFETYIDYGFTADLEAKLDEITAEKVKWKPLLEEWWTPFRDKITSLSTLRVSEVIDALDEKLGQHLFGEETYDGHVHINPDQMPNASESASATSDAREVTDARRCPSCKTGRLGLKPSKSGGFIGCSRYPECGFTHPLHPIRGAIVSDTDDADFMSSSSEEGEGIMYPKSLGVDPETGSEVTLRLGPYGPYLQLGEKAAPLTSEDGKKVKKSPAPRRVGVANIEKDVSELTLEDALKLFQYPKEIGKHPETQSPVSINMGPFGYYVACDGVNASITKTVLKRVGSLDGINLEEALELLRKKAERPPRTRGRFAKKTVKAAKEKKEKPLKSTEKKPKKETASKTAKAKKETSAAGPKKPLTAFFMFSADEREKVKADNPTFKVGDVAKALGERWANLDPERKARYESAAKEAKEAWMKAKSDSESG